MHIQWKNVLLQLTTGNCEVMLKGLKSRFSHGLVGSASMARKIYLRGGIRVGAFYKIYGGCKSNGSRPSHLAKSSGSIAREVLKQLEAIDILEKDVKGMFGCFACLLKLQQAWAFNSNNSSICGALSHWCPPIRDMNEKILRLEKFVQMGVEIIANHKTH